VKQPLLSRRCRGSFYLKKMRKTMSNRLSNHHIMHERFAWTSRPEAKELRDTRSLIPRIPRDIHDELHIQCPHVPLLGSYALQNVARLFEPTGRTLDDMDGLMSAIERASRHPRAHMIERDLAGLAIEAIDLQRPFVRKGLIR
jgi:hypothetical protein